MTKKLNNNYNKIYFDNKFKTEDPWKFKTSKYEKEKYKKQLLLIKKYYSSPKKILEIGCAEGVFTKLLKNTFKKTHITAVDISSTAIQRAKQNIKEVTFLQGNILKIINKFTNNKFDVIILSETIYYLGTYINFLQMYSFIKNIKNKINNKGILVTANITDLKNNEGVFLIERPIVESYYALLSGQLKLIKSLNYKNKKKGQIKINYGIRVFKKT